MMMAQDEQEWTPKAVKEAFYRNHAGAPKQEVFCLVVCQPLTIALCRWHVQEPLCLGSGTA